ncbi:MAG TPA: hypothetical protein VN549_05555 [Negativicutes bacterium]|nr:hypothetical protein [Negativicutes bacterium]
MDIERVKEAITKNMLIKVAIAAVAVVALILYFRTFLTKGIFYDGNFLRKEAAASETYYRGRGPYGYIHITVRGIKDKDPSAEVIYKLPNNISSQYTVTFRDRSHWAEGIENIKDEKGSVVFEGEYRRGSLFLIDKNGELVMDMQFRVEGIDPYDQSYKVPLANIASTASFDDEAIRGRLDLLFPAVLLLAFILIDIRFPLFFFSLKHWWDVKDPEPSDLYVSMQRLSWRITPIIAIVLMIAAVV